MDESRGRRTAAQRKAAEPTESVAKSETVPASARPLTDPRTGLRSELHYSRSHLRKILEMKKAGRRVKLPPGYDSIEQLEEAVNGTPAAAEGSTDTGDAGSLSNDSNTPTGTAGASNGTVE